MEWLTWVMVAKLSVLVAVGTVATCLIIDEARSRR